MQEQPVDVAGQSSFPMSWIDLLYAHAKKCRTRGELGFDKSPLHALEAIVMMRLLFQWVLSALSLMMVTKLLPGFHIKDFGSALGVAAVYGIFHVVLYPLLLFVAFIPVLLSFGLFIFVINAFLLVLTSALLDHFQMDNMSTALIGAVLLTMLNGIWRWLLF
jgi:putative membrane protein